MKKFTEEELNKIADNVYNEIKSESGIETDDDNLSMAIVDVSLNTIIKFITKLQEAE